MQYCAQKLKQQDIAWNLTKLNQRDIAWNLNKTGVQPAARGKEQILNRRWPTGQI